MRLCDLTPLRENKSQSTKQKTGADTIFNQSIDPNANLPGAPAGAPPGAAERPKQQKSLGRTASREQTAEKASRVRLPGQASSLIQDLMRNVPDNYEDPDPQMALDQPVTPATLPAVISNSMVAAGMITPEWHMVSNLPGYLQRPIRQLGRAVFNQYTDTPVEQIQVLADLNGSGPNDARELNALGKWVVDNGAPVTDGEIDFAGSMPGYKAQVKIFNVGDAQVMLVKDAMGNYAYAWPTSQAKNGRAATGDRVPATSLPTEPRRQLTAKSPAKEPKTIKPDDADIFDWS